jgi:hypothetical protein
MVNYTFLHCNLDAISYLRMDAARVRSTRAAMSSQCG